MTRNLPKGVRRDHGYIQVRVVHRGVTVFCKNFGPETPEAVDAAAIAYSDTVRKIRMNQWGFRDELKSMKFSVVATTIFLPRWSALITPEGKQKHSDGSIVFTGRLVQRLVAYFGKFDFDLVKPKNVEAYREALMARGCSGTTANRYQNALSSIFSHVKQWVELEKISAFKLPPINPCDSVDTAALVKRERIIDAYEAKKLKYAFLEVLDDADGWEICKLALKSVLSEADLRRIAKGDGINLARSKTGVRVDIPITVLVGLNWKNWRRRWNDAREAAGLADVQFRDLRKTGINWLKGRHDLKLVSEYAGHADIKTTEANYTVVQREKLRPLAADLDAQVEEI